MRIWQITKFYYTASISNKTYCIFGHKLSPFPPEAPPSCGVGGHFHPSLIYPVGNRILKKLKVIQRNFIKAKLKYNTNVGGGCA